VQRIGEDALARVKGVGAFGGLVYLARRAAMVWLWELFISTNGKIGDGPDQ